MTRALAPCPWATRVATFILPSSSWTASVWFKYGDPEGTEHIEVYELLNGDGRAHVSPDGNWNSEPRPIHPPMTYDEAVRRLTGCGLAPPMRGVKVGDEWCYTFELLRDTGETPTWAPWEK